MSLRPLIFGVIWKIQYLWRRYTWRYGHDIDRFLRTGKGVIHVGANIGQERDHYEKNRLRVVWVEPIPDVYRELLHNIRNHPRQVAINALVTDRDDCAYEFHVADNGGLSSSILDMRLHRDIWPQVGFSATITLSSVTLETLLRANDLSPAQFDCLVLDTQGSELLVLQGASPLLPSFRFIKAEVADFEAYQGCCLLSELDEFLRRHGFTEFDRITKASHPNGGRYYDVVYRRAKS